MLSVNVVKVFLLTLVLLSACASHIPPSTPKGYEELLNRYPETHDPLNIQKITAQSLNAATRRTSPTDVFIIVHPAYSVFFRDAQKAKYSKIKYDLLKKQFDNETRSIADRVSAGDLVVIIVPGNYGADSVAPLSYTAYLNTVASASRSVYYVYSESSSTGKISMEDMINLYRFLLGVKVNKVMMGGGFIGRCQREFYNQLTTYLDKAQAFIVPEMSSLSLDDISDEEAVTILSSIEQQDYSPVRLFIDRKLEDKVNVLPLSRKKEL